LVYLSIFLFPNSYIILFSEFYFLPFSVHAQTNVKVKQSHYRPGVAQRVPGSSVPQISWQQHRMVVRLSALCTGCLYPQENTPGTHFC
jgi:hypothetical protein